MYGSAAEPTTVPPLRHDDGVFPCRVSAALLSYEPGEGLLLVGAGPGSVWSLPRVEVRPGVRSDLALRTWLRDDLGIAVSSLTVETIHERVVSSGSDPGHEIVLVYRADVSPALTFHGTRRYVRWSVRELSVISWDWVVRDSLMSVLT